MYMPYNYDEHCDDDDGRFLIEIGDRAVVQHLEKYMRCLCCCCCLYIIYYNILLLLLEYLLIAGFLFWPKSRDVRVPRLSAFSDAHAAHCYLTPP